MFELKLQYEFDEEFMDRDQVIRDLLGRSSVL